MPQDSAAADPAPPVAERATGPALWRGVRGRCPNCGEGRILHSYLKINADCPACGQDFTAARADDGPAYLTILLVGHLMAPILHLYFVRLRPDPWEIVAVFGIGCTVLSLALLPRIKGGMVGLQWAKGMGDFGRG